MPPVIKIQHTLVTSRRRPGGPDDLGRLRIALCAVFAAHGFMFASWAVRVPAVKEQAGASSAALGLALLGLSAGAVATMLLAGALCRRFGSPRVTVLSCAVLSLTLPFPALARSALPLGLLLAGFGAAYGCLNVAMNSVAVDIVTALRRPVMPGFHAAWSFGGLVEAGRVRRGSDRRLGSAAPAAGPRSGRERGRRGLCGLRAGRGERAAVRDGAARATRPHQGADPGRSDRLRGHAPGQPRP